MPGTGLIWDLRRRSLRPEENNFTRTNFLGSKEFIQRLRLETTLDVHEGSVNSLCWNETGEYILSGSDDGNLVITNPHRRTVQTVVKTRHRSSIHSARFMPQTGSHVVVSAGADGSIFHTDVTREPGSAADYFYHCHSGAVYKVATVASDPHSFLSCGEDGTVRWFDLRSSPSCKEGYCRQEVLVDCRRAVSSMALSPQEPFYLAAGCSDSSVRVYDRRMLGTMATGSPTGSGALGMVARFVPPHLTTRRSRVTSLSYSEDGRQVLASYSSDGLFLFDPRDDVAQQLTAPPLDGRSEARTPPARRLRLRGDWSDTGPLARPERERERDGEVSLLQKISDMMSRWFEEASEVQGHRQTTQAPPTGETSSTEGRSEHPASLQDPGQGEQPARTPSMWDLLPGQVEGRWDPREQEEDRPGGRDRTTNGFSLRGSAMGEQVLRRYSAARIQEIFRRRIERQELEDSETRQVRRPAVSMVFKGHRNSRTMTQEACFWGPSLVLSGSDCGHVFAWRRSSGRLLMLLEADAHVVTCLQPHPHQPVLATSGIDYNVKIWSPTERFPAFNSKLAEEVVCRNDLMLKETGNTITVPASFMLRMLASLNQSFRPDHSEVEPAEGLEAEDEADP